MANFIKIVIETAPAVLFFGCYQVTKDIHLATIFLFCGTLASMAFFLIRGEKPEKRTLISTILILVFGGLSIFFEDSDYIKMKVTLINLLFSFLIFLGLLLKRNSLAYLFGNLIAMEKEGWNILSKRLIFFFFTMAVINELVWRNASETFWVNLKFFGYAPMAFIFLVSQYQVFKKYAIESPLPESSDVPK